MIIIIIILKHHSIFLFYLTQPDDNQMCNSKCNNANYLRVFFEYTFFFDNIHHELLILFYAVSYFMQHITLLTILESKHQ